MSKIGERRERLPLRFPFGKAVENLRSTCLSREDYDPATLFVWGQMMALGVLRILQAVEERFGAEGQEVCRRAINDLGRGIFLEMASGVEIPAHLSDIEVASLMTSWINEVLYASIEEAFIKNEDKAGFHICYCPHQDVYRPFDCRVQRYFVEGTMQAARELWGDKGNFDAFFRYSIPQGRDTCLFEMKRREGEADRWRQYSEELQHRALERVKRKKREKK
ncbi:MAG: hypothetical protein FJ005_02125 [Chloroflexi bacterium]|nr:hypothetical protein [Chloroflexota bacterium]